MPTLNLRPEWLDIVRRLVALHVPEAEVFAYGSRVNGTCHDGSDLDLLVRNPNDPAQPISGVTALREALSDSKLPILVDVMDWARIPDNFRKEISQSPQVLIFTPNPRAQA